MCIFSARLHSQVFEHTVQHSELLTCSLLRMTCWGITYLFSTWKFLTCVFHCFVVHFCAFMVDFGTAVFTKSVYEFNRTVSTELLLDIDWPLGHCRTNGNGNRWSLAATFTSCHNFRGKPCYIAFAGTGGVTKSSPCKTSKWLPSNNRQIYPRPPVWLYTTHCNKVAS